MQPITVQTAVNIYHNGRLHQKWLDLADLHQNRNYLEYMLMHIMIEMTDIVMRQGWEGKCEDEEEKEIQRELTDLLSCTVLQE